MAKDHSTGLGSQFHFISIQNPAEAKDRAKTRVARSHAVSRGLENKRKLQEKSGLNFRGPSLKCKPGRTMSAIVLRQTPAKYIWSPCPDVFGPFQDFAAESPILRDFLDCHKAREFGHPVLSLLDELVLQNLTLVLRKERDDNALLNSVMLTYLFVATSGNIGQECLTHQSEALCSIRQSMSIPDRATSESTLGAILLLAGIEARLGMPRKVQLHMGAIEQLLNLCRKNGIYLSDGIKRAIFWQDLNSSIMTGSNRVVDHKTFSELRWRRDHLPPDSFVLPPGFQTVSHLLGEEFVDIIKDVHALQRIRDTISFGRTDVLSMARIDNHQASIQSRLVNLPNPSSISECCHLAAYLCSTMLRCKLWSTSTIPSHLSLQLFCKLQRANDDLVWVDRPDLLAWLIYIGGAFSPSGKLRSDYILLLHCNRNTRFRGLFRSWLELLQILKQFIWSDNAFTSQVKAFWEESSDDAGPNETGGK